MEYVLLIFGTLIMVNLGVGTWMSEAANPPAEPQPEVIIQDAQASADFDPGPALVLAQNQR